MLTIDGIGRLDKRIEILEPCDAIDEYGLTHQTLKDVYGHKLWARIEPLRGTQALEAHKVLGKESIKITIRYHKGMSTDMLVRYKSRIYEITSIQNPYEGNVKLELLCTYRKVGDDTERDES